VQQTTEKKEMNVLAAVATKAPGVSIESLDFCKLVLETMKKENLHISTDEELFASNDDFGRSGNEIEVLGRGSFGTVLAIKGEKKAVKIVSMSENDWNHSVGEISFMRKYYEESIDQHYASSVARFYGYYITTDAKLEILRWSKPDVMGIIDFYDKYREEDIKTIRKKLEEYNALTELLLKHQDVLEEQERELNSASIKSMEPGVANGKQIKQIMDSIEVIKKGIENVTRDIEIKKTYLSREGPHRNAEEEYALINRKRLVVFIVMEKIKGKTVALYANDLFVQMPARIVSGEEVATREQFLTTDTDFAEVVRIVLLIFKKAFVLLDRVHKMGVYHGDASLRNLMVKNTGNDVDDFATVVLDFGISCLLRVKTVMENEQLVCPPEKFTRHDFSIYNADFWKKKNERTLIDVDYYDMDFFILAYFIYDLLESMFKQRYAGKTEKLGNMNWIFETIKALPGSGRYSATVRQNAAEKVANLLVIYRATHGDRELRRDARQFLSLGESHLSPVADETPPAKKPKENPPE